MELEVFSDEQIRDVDLIDIDRLKKEAENIDDERLREENIDTLVNEIVDGELLTPPKVRTDQAERTVESEPPNAEVRVEMPATGDIELLKHPNVSLSNSEEPFRVEYEDRMLSYVVEVGDRTSDLVNQEINDRQSMLEIKPDQAADEIEDKNENAKRAVRRAINRRREEIKSEEEKLADIINPDDDDGPPHFG